MSAENLRAEILAADIAGLSEKRVHVFAELPSTNSWLMDNVPATVGKPAIALAIHQSAGRGRQGKAWIAPPQSGLCLSVALRYETGPTNPAALSIAFGVAIAEQLDALGVSDVMLKWPNDLVWQDRKLGGLLVESRQGRNKTFVVVAGVGINVNLPVGFSLPANATSWAKDVCDLKQAGLEIKIGALAVKMIPAIITALSGYPSVGASIAAQRFNRRNWLRDRLVSVDGVSLRCANVDSEGRLLATDPKTGETHPIISGEIVPLAEPKA